MTYVAKKIATIFRRLLGIDDLEKEIRDLTSKNEQIMKEIEDHEKTLSHIAIIQVRTINDLFSIANAIKGKNKIGTFKRNPDDDIVN